MGALWWGSYSGVGWWVGECLQNGPENCQVCQLNPSVLSVPVERVASTTCGACCLQVDKAPLESYADIGGLEQQIQEIKEAVEYPLSHPELYEDIGIKPPKGVSQGSIRGCPVIGRGVRTLRPSCTVPRGPGRPCWRRRWRTRRRRRSCGWWAAS